MKLKHCEISAQSSIAVKADFNYQPKWQPWVAPTFGDKSVFCVWCCSVHDKKLCKWYKVHFYRLIRCFPLLTWIYFVRVYFIQDTTYFHFEQNCFRFMFLYLCYSVLCSYLKTIKKTKSQILLHRSFSCSMLATLFLHSLNYWNANYLQSFTYLIITKALTSKTIFFFIDFHMNGFSRQNFKH